MDLDTGKIPLKGERKIVYLGETGSTNNDLVELIRRGEAKAGDIVCASRQTAGRGRRGNCFSSPDGGIYFSFAAQNKAGSLATVCAGVAVAKTLEGSGYSPSIKWVNDVNLGGKKVCGILAEAVSGTDLCVIGIGVNLKAAALPQELSETATALDAENGTLPHAEELVGKTVAAYEELSLSGGAEVIGEYKKYLSFLGKEIVIKQTGEVCLAVDVNGSGELVVVFPDGKRRVLNSGEISIKINK